MTRAQRLKTQREWKRAQRKRLKVQDPEALRRIDRNKSLKDNYGITLEEYHVIEETQNYVCAICQEPEPTHRYLSVDHDHKRDKGVVSIRGLLCSLCNHGLGRFRDNPESLKRAIAYLEGYESATSRWHDALTEAT